MPGEHGAKKSCRLFLFGNNRNVYFAVDIYLLGKTVVGRVFVF